ncbi:hypothetical protein H8959_011103 [Pygathrix nigripes]
MFEEKREELEDVSDLEEEHEVRSHTSIQTEGKTDRAKMTQLPEAEKEKIAEQVADFKKVKSKLDAEIEIWDDTSNDIIVLAKNMCMIMMEMTDFTRQILSKRYPDCELKQFLHFVTFVMLQTISFLP